ncbi:MAG: hypothetical protein BWZ10_00751 [candidate division BRC1 bacterium ADurb.BinA364]|nr:MAG: hypothetical protein BWZ10_00751 [candidate division BRC1 bacterium ADurb.BinA364]
MSYKPQRLGSLTPTGCVRLPAFSLYQTYASIRFSLSPKYQRPLLPARQAYSHCASVGSE